MPEEKDKLNEELKRLIEEELEAEGEDIQSILRHTKVALQALSHRIAIRLLFAVTQIADALLPAIISLVINIILAVILVSTVLIRTPNIIVNLLYTFVVLAVLFAVGRVFNNRQYLKYNKRTLLFKELNPELYLNIDVHLERLERL